MQLNKKIKRDIKYTNKDFGELRLSLINHAKNYFPNVYKDFNESSPGMMFIEMAAYVGDVLNFYADTQLQESFLYTVNERKNLYNLSQGLGYKPKTLVPAQVDIDVMQLIPAIGNGNDTKPDYRYALVIEPELIISSDDNVQFRTIEEVNFAASSSANPTIVDIHSVLPNGEIEFFILKKSVKAVEGVLHVQSYEFNDPKPYDKIVIREENVSEILDIVDSDGNKWYEVPYMAQDLVAMPIRNTPFNDKNLSEFSDSVPYLLCFKQTEKRFVTRIRKDNLFEIQFGSGMGYEADEEVLPNPYNVAIGIDYFRRVEDISIDPLNFLYTKTYGIAPNNTTLNVRYTTSTGMTGNVGANTLNSISNLTIKNQISEVNQVIYNNIISNIVVNNPLPAYGGMNKKDLDVIREEAMANFAAQNRAVTKDDYILRCYTMPSKYGDISKAYIESDTQLSRWNSLDTIQNPFSMNLYVLSYNADGQFVECNPALKNNLRQYLKQYRLLTDAINIKTPFIVNIGINYEVVTQPNQNSYEVLIRCNEALIEMFSQKNMEIGRPIIISDIRTKLDKVEGVQSIQDIEFVNLYDKNFGYSGNIYSVKDAIRNNVLYPSKDPCIFEIKFPKHDIRGRVIDL